MIFYLTNVKPLKIMESINFPEANLELAKDQPQYNSLFVNVDPTISSRPVTCCLRLSEEEAAKFMETREIWVIQNVYDHLYEPMRISVDKPEMVKHDLNIT